MPQPSWKDKINEVKKRNLNTKHSITLDPSNLFNEQILVKKSYRESFLEFNHKIGMPKKEGIKSEIWDYEWEVFDKLANNSNLWIKKATGLGITELLLRYIAWACYHKWTNSNIVIVTGPRLELSITLMDRLKKLFVDELFVSKNTVAEINGNRIEAYPSHHLDAMRGLDRVQFILLDEADFFNPKEQDEARAISERYFGKFGSQIIMVSTPHLPGGLFERMEKTRDPRYEYLFLPYTLGLNKIYRDEDIIEAQGPSFEREYNLKYGIGIGNIFPYELVDLITEDYDLVLKDGEKCMAVDPAYGSSKFALAGFESLNDILYVKDAMEFERPDPTAMIELIKLKSRDYGNYVLADSARPEIIKGLQDAGVNARPVVFGQKMDTGTLASEMTIIAAQMVKDKKVRIHPSFKDLIAQLKSAAFDGKGKVDKSSLNFDLGDCFIMGCYFMHRSNPIVINVDSPDTPNKEEVTYEKKTIGRKHGYVVPYED